MTPNGVSITAHVGNELSAAIRRKEMTLDLLLTQDQGSSIVDGINHLRKVPIDIYNAKIDSVHFLEKSLVSKDVQIFCVKCKNVCSKITTAGYVLLILSLSLSPYIAKWLSVVDLNCITMWSLTLLYITLELKTDVCAWVFNKLLAKSEKKRSKNNPIEETDEIAV